MNFPVNFLQSHWMSRRGEESTLDMSLPGLRDLRGAVQDEQKRRQNEQQRLSERFQVPGTVWHGLEATKIHDTFFEGLEKEEKE